MIETAFWPLSVASRWIRRSAVQRFWSGRFWRALRRPHVFRRQAGGRVRSGGVASNFASRARGRPSSQPLLILQSSRFPAVGVRCRAFGALGGARCWKWSARTPHQMLEVVSEPASGCSVRWAVFQRHIEGLMRLVGGAGLCRRARRRSRRAWSWRGSSSPRSICHTSRGAGRCERST